MAAVPMSELELALDMTSDAGADALLVICIDTGKILCICDGSEDELPDDYETSDLYLAVPDKWDLDLGNQLAFDFARKELPDDYTAVVDCFRHKGAYSRFKQLLETRGVLENWYEFENSATEAAPCAWCEKNGIQVDDS